MTSFWMYDEDEIEQDWLEDMEAEEDVNEAHWKQRDAKIAKRKHGMRVDGRSIFTIQQAQQKRDNQKRGAK